MTLAERAVRAAAHLLTPARRDAKLEEWLADLEGAQDLSMSRHSVVLGVAILAVQQLPCTRNSPKRTAPPMTETAVTGI